MENFPDALQKYPRPGLWHDPSVTLLCMSPKWVSLTYQGDHWHSLCFTESVTIIKTQNHPWCLCSWGSFRMELLARTYVKNSFIRLTIRCGWSSLTMAISQGPGNQIIAHRVGALAFPIWCQDHGRFLEIAGLQSTLENERTCLNFTERNHVGNICIKRCPRILQGQWRPSNNATCSSSMFFLLGHYDKVPSTFRIDFPLPLKPITNRGFHKPTWSRCTF